MILERHSELARLNPADKLLLVNELWDDLAANPDQIPVSDESIAELDHRMEEYRKDPSPVSTWEEIQLRILGYVQPIEPIDDYAFLSDSAELVELSL